MSDRQTDTVPWLVPPCIASRGKNLARVRCRMTHHLALAASALQPLKSGTLSLYLSVPVPALMPFVVTSRPTTASRPSNPLNPSPLAPQIRLCWPLCAFINYILLTCLHVFLQRTPSRKTSSVSALSRSERRWLLVCWRFICPAGRRTDCAYKAASTTRLSSLQRSAAGFT